MTPPSWPEALKFFLEWARENHVGPLQTFIFGLGVVGLFFFSRFVRSAKRVVNDVHHVYEQALEDSKRATTHLRTENEVLQQRTKYLLDELEDERKIKEDLLRTLARMRAQRASEPPQE